MKPLKWSTVVLVVVTTAGCAVNPQYEPALEYTITPLDGFFIGTAAITTDYSADKPIHAICNVSATFHEGKYTITGTDDVVASSSGRYGMGSQFLLRHEGSDRVGAAAQRVLSGLFDYQWGTVLLVLEQWDPAQDRLTLVVLERTSQADALLPYGTPNATATSPPFGPPRRRTSFPTASTQ